VQTCVLILKHAGFSVDFFLETSEEVICAVAIVSDAPCSLTEIVKVSRGGKRKQDSNSAFVVASEKGQGVIENKSGVEHVDDDERPGNRTKKKV